MPILHFNHEHASIQLLEGMCKYEDNNMMRHPVCNTYYGFINILIFKYKSHKIPCYFPYLYKLILCTMLNKRAVLLLGKN